MAETFLRSELGHIEKSADAHPDKSRGYLHTGTGGISCLKGLRAQLSAAHSLCRRLKKLSPLGPFLFFLFVDA